MAGRSRDPKQLNEVALVEVSSPEGAYGLDHAPAYDAATRSAVYADAGATIEATFRELDPLAVMAALGAIESATALLPPPQEVYIATVELAQAWALRNPASARLPRPDALRRLTSALLARSHLALGETSQETTDERSSILQRRMTLTTSVRHSDYPHHAMLVTRAIAHELGEFGRQSLGAAFGDLMRVTETAASLVTFKLKSQGVPAEVMRWLAGEEEDFKPDWLGAFHVDAAVVAKAAGLAVPVVEAVLDALSMAPGDLDSANTDHFHLGNPVWRKPFVKGGGRHFLFSPGTILSSATDISAELAARASPKGLQALGDARGAALETLLGRTLPELVPSGEVLTGVHWFDPIEGKRRETDAVVLVDGIAIIFEAKGDAMNAAARRGSATWLKTFDDIVVSAAYQATRLETVLRDLTLPTLEIESDQGARTIRKEDVHHVIRFGVSFERVTMASAVIDRYLADRVRRSGGEPMPIFTIADLWQIRDLIPGEGRRIHFLLRRAELETSGAVLGDELDLIALYLTNGFVGIGGANGEGAPVVAFGLSDFLRHFQKGTPHFDPDARAPVLTTPLWDRLIREKEEGRPGLWTSVVYDLLNIELASQERFIDDIKGLRRRIRRSAGKAGYDGVMMQAPAQPRPSAFACLVSGRMPPADRLRLARTTFADLSEAHPDERLTVLTLDATKDAVAPAFTYYRGTEWHSVRPRDPSTSEPDE